MADVGNNEKSRKIRDVIINGEPWFYVDDIANAEVLYPINGESLNDVVTDYVSEKDKRRVAMAIMSCGETQDVITINRSGLYSLMLHSRIPDEEEFERLITSEVLPVLQQASNYECSNYMEFRLRMWDDNIREIKSPCLSIQINDIE